MNNEKWWKNLYPIRVPLSNWRFIYNKLQILEPDEMSADQDAWDSVLTQDILNMRSERGEQTVILDLGWYPDGEPSGQYRLIALLDEDYLNPILEFTSRSTKEVVDTLELWLFEYLGHDPIDEKAFRKRHPNKGRKS